MNVTFNPYVNFKSETNLIAEAGRKIVKEQEQSSNTVSTPTSSLKQGQNDRFERIAKEMIEEGKSIDTIIKGKHWQKTYDPATNTVYAKIPNSYDGNEYTIYPDGKVVVTNGWGKNEVEREANEELADYVKQRKEEYENEIHKGFENKSDIEKPVSDEKSNQYTSREYTQAELDEKANVFAERLKSRKWKKEYLPENDIIVIRPKRLKDDIEYMIKNDGTVLETGLRSKATVIVEPNSQSAKTFAKYKKKLDPNAPKTSLWMKGKEVVADIWKFFSVAGTMGVATGKGLWQGAITGASVIAAASIIRGTMAFFKSKQPISNIILKPLQTAGLAGKLAALAAGGAVLAANIIAGKMKANQNSAVIEHKIDVPHTNN